MPKDNELISVIIPVYNVEKYLEKCVDSVKKQTYDNIEIILVDDGSTDKSGEICDIIANGDNRVKVIHKKNGGLSDARNAGIKIANGELIGFVDSDDYICQDMYMDLYLILKKDDSDISICDFVKIKENDDNKEYCVKNKNINFYKYNKIEALNELLKNEKITNHAWNKLYKKSLFDNIKYPVGKNMEDMATTYLLFEKANRISYIEKTEYFYLERANSILGNVNKKLIYDLKNISEKRYEYLWEKYPEVHENLIISQIKNAKIMFSNLILCNLRKDFFGNEYEKEYRFYKENYKFNIGKCKLSKKQKIEYNLLYNNKFLYWYLFKLKIIIKNNGVKI